MTTEFISAHSDDTVGLVVDQIKKVSQSQQGMYFVYVVDESNKFLGVVSMRRLLIAGPEIRVGEIVDENTKFATTTLGQSVLEVASLMTKYNLLSVAVLDEGQKLLGIVTVDDIMRHFVPHA